MNSLKILFPLLAAATILQAAEKLERKTQYAR